LFAQQVQILDEASLLGFLRGEKLLVENWYTTHNLLQFAIGETRQVCLNCAGLWLWVSKTKMVNGVLLLVFPRPNSWNDACQYRVAWAAIAPVLPVFHMTSRYQLTARRYPIVTSKIEHNSVSAIVASRKPVHDA